MSTRTATASLLPERAAQFRTLLDDCLAGLTLWIHSARSSPTPPAPGIFSQLALALDRLVTVAARIEPAGASPTSTTPPSLPVPSPQDPRVTPSPSVSEPVSPSRREPSSPPVPPIQSIQSMVSMLSAMTTPRTPRPTASKSTPHTPSAPPPAPSAAPASCTQSTPFNASLPPTPSPPRPSTITAALVRKRRRKKK